MRCNWSVDYYLSCACQIKIIKMQGGRDREWNVSGLLHCGRVVHAFPEPETDRNLTTLLRRTSRHLENWIPPPFLPVSLLNSTVDECMTGQDMFPSYKLRRKLGCWEMEKCWRTWASLWVDWQLWQHWDVRSGLYRSQAVQGRQKAWRLPDTRWLMLRMVILTVWGHVDNANRGNVKRVNTY